MTRRLMVLALSLLIVALALVGTPALSQDSPPNLVTVPATSAQATGNWQSLMTMDGPRDGTLVSSGSPDDVLELRFNGPVVEVVYVQDVDMGTLAVEVDGAVLRTINAASQTRVADARTTIDYLDDAPHMVRVYPVRGAVAVRAFRVSGLALHVTAGCVEQDLHLNIRGGVGPYTLSHTDALPTELSAGRAVVPGDGDWRGVAVTGANDERFVVGDVPCVRDTEIVQDGSLELGTGNPYWVETSLLFDDVVIVDIPVGGAHTGIHYAYFGGAGGAGEISTLSQTLTIPNMPAAKLVFYFACNTFSGNDGDYFEVRMDSDVLWTFNNCGAGRNWTGQVLDVSAYADGGEHTLMFYGTDRKGDNSNWFVDTVSIVESTQPLLAVARCVDYNLRVEITGGDAPFSITGTGPDLPQTGLTLGIYTIDGPNMWTDVTVSEEGGDQESIAFGERDCTAPVRTLALFNDLNIISLINTLDDWPDWPDDYGIYLAGTGVTGHWLMGDWDGDYVYTPGVYADGANAGAFFFTNDTGEVPPDEWLSRWIGFEGYPVAGRMDADYNNDCLGVVETWGTPPDDAYALHYTCEFDGPVAPTMYGQWLGRPLADQDGFSGERQYVVGDWDRDGVDSIAVRRGPHIAYSNVSPGESKDDPLVFAVFDLAQYIGDPVPAFYGTLVAGDWDGDLIDSFGLFYNDGFGSFFRRNDLLWNSGEYIVQNVGQPLGDDQWATTWYEISP